MATNENNQIIWKRRPSEMRGYERAMYTTLENGDYLRVDYNIGEKLARLYVEVSEDKGSSYYAVINKGRVTIEKNSNGRSTRVSERLVERNKEFSTIPSRDVLKVINNNYGITSFRSINRNANKERLQVEREEIKKRYFRPEDNPYAEASTGWRRRRARIGLIDLIDTMTGIIISLFVFFIGEYNLIAAGAAAVIWGMLLGVFDILFREREPVFSKILFFLVSGAGIYFYSYFYL